MGLEHIPDDLKRFILTSVPSVPFLEAMLLLRNGWKDEWDASRLAKRLYISERAAAALLRELHEARILTLSEADPTMHRYYPASPELRDMIDRLAITYARHLVEISNLIHSKTNKQAHQFADAFKWRKDL